MLVHARFIYFISLLKAPIGTLLSDPGGLADSPSLPQAVFSRIEREEHAARAKAKPLPDDR